MHYENLKKLNQEILGIFQNWIKHLPIQLLNNLTPQKFSKEEKVNIDESINFFHSLFENDFATIKINVKCSHCGTMNTIYDYIPFIGDYRCNECDFSIDEVTIKNGEIIYVLKVEYFDQRSSQQSKTRDPMALFLNSKKISSLQNSNKIINLEEKKEMKSEQKKKPRVFIGSSVEGLEVAKAIQAEIEFETEPTIWHQGVFNISSTAIDDLIDKFKKTDFAIFVTTPDDLSKIRNKDYNVVRDNVIFEIGLSMGIMGKRNVFFIKPRGYGDFHFPSDLLGITPGEYDGDRSDDEIRSAIGPAVSNIMKQIKKWDK